MVLRIGGFSFLEVLISLFLLAFSSLVFADYLLFSQKYSQNSFYRTIAILERSNYFELKKNLFSYDEISLWKNSVAKLIPSSHVTIKKDNVVICWPSKIFGGQKSCL